MYHHLLTISYFQFNKIKINSEFASTKALFTDKKKYKFKYFRNTIGYPEAFKETVTFRPTNVM